MELFIGVIVLTNFLQKGFVVTPYDRSPIRYFHVLIDWEWILLIP